MIVAMPLALEAAPEVRLPGGNRETIEGLEIRINRSDVYPRIGFRRSFGMLATTAEANAPLT
jgi:hypothetical protein